MTDLNAYSMALIGATFLGAVINASTGFGFAMIIAPMLLISVAATDAVQIASILTFAIVLSLAPFLLRKCHPVALKNMILGSIVGFPVGSAFLFFAPNIWLKLFAALIVTYALFKMIRDKMSYRHSINISLSEEQPLDERLSFRDMMFPSFFSGLLNAAMAMPGPPVMAFLSISKMDRKTIRATLITFMSFSYAGLIAMHFTFIGMSENVFSLLKLLAMPTFLGIVFGHFLSDMISENIFKWLTLTLMVGVLAGLGTNIFQTVFSLG